MATSAAALTIQSVGPNSNHVSWLVSAFYSAAFGISLQGLIHITYITISATGSSDEAIGRLSAGVLFKNQPTRPVALMMALPATLTTYSAVYLLAGLAAMIFEDRSASNEESSRESYVVLAMFPICVVFVQLICSIVACEIGRLIEIHGRAKAMKKIREIQKRGDV